jgi:hypothetical protein
MDVYGMAHGFITYNTLYTNVQNCHDYGWYII